MCVFCVLTTCHRGSRFFFVIGVHVEVPTGILIWLADFENFKWIIGVSPESLGKFKQEHQKVEVIEKVERHWYLDNRWVPVLSLSCRGVLLSPHRTPATGPKNQSRFCPDSHLNISNNCCKQISPKIGPWFSIFAVLHCYKKIRIFSTQKWVFFGGWHDHMIRSLCHHVLQIFFQISLFS